MGEAVKDIPRVVAHRGLHMGYPENSFSAMKTGWEGRGGWCECDVHLSADGEVVVIHDDKLDRTTTGSGLVCRRSWAELRELRLRDGAGRPTEERLPSLKELLGMMPAEAGLLLEIKAAFGKEDVPGLVKMLEGHRCIAQSFRVDNITLVMQSDPGMRTAWLVDDAGQAVAGESMIPSPCPGMCAGHGSLNADVVRLLHDQGRWVGAWTVNKAADMRRMLAIGVDMIITDDPATVWRLMDAP